jgi:cytochrome P450
MFVSVVLVLIARRFSIRRRRLAASVAALVHTAFEYNLFYAGSHMCIDATFAMMEIRNVLVMLLQRFRLQYPHTDGTAPRSAAVGASLQGSHVIVFKPAPITLHEPTSGS